MIRPTKSAPIDPVLVVDGERLRRKRLSTPSDDRHRRSMNQKELAEAAFISRSYLNEIEAGLKQPRLRVALSIAKALGCDLDELIS